MYESIYIYMYVCKDGKANVTLLTCMCVQMYVYSKKSTYIRTLDIHSFQVLRMRTYHDRACQQHTLEFERQSTRRAMSEISDWRWIYDGRGEVESYHQPWYPWIRYSQSLSAHIPPRPRLAWIASLHVHRHGSLVRLGLSISVYQSTFWTQQIHLLQIWHPAAQQPLDNLLQVFP